MDQRLLTTREVASRLGVSTGTVCRWVHDGLIPGIRVRSNLLRFELAEVMGALKDRGTDQWAGRRPLWPARSLAARLGVDAHWLVEEAVEGRISGVRAGGTWLFEPALVESQLLVPARRSGENAIADGLGSKTQHDHDGSPRRPHQRALDYDAHADRKGGTRPK
ncbi:MAG: excisionase family DNA binding protein [Myxococcota bacterium]|jgi:excisionase family DNA binding protein